jgi:hypothetical protein
MTLAHTHWIQCHQPYMYTNGPYMHTNDVLPRMYTNGPYMYTYDIYYHACIPMHTTFIPTYKQKCHVTSLRSKYFTRPRILNHHSPNTPTPTTPLHTYYQYTSIKHTKHVRLVQTYVLTCGAQR